MSGITSGIGLVSGLDTGSLINQLLSIEARPRQLAQQRILQLQSQQAALLDLNSRLSTLKTAAAKFRSARVFQAATATSSNTGVLTARAQPGAPLGSFSFLVDRVVQSQQALSRGFVDRNSTGLGLTSVTIESAQARLDRDTELAMLNGGEGVSRGRVIVTDASGASATIDLSRVATVNEVLEAFNSAQGVRVRMSVQGDRFVLTDISGGGGTMSVQSGSGYSTAASLGIEGAAVGGTINGERVLSLGDSLTLASLRDGLGVGFNNAVGNATADFTVRTRDGSTYNVDIGNIYGDDGQLTASAVSTIGQLRQRIADQTQGKVTLDISSDGRGFRLVDTSEPTGSDSFTITANSTSTAATDLGIVGSSGDGVIGGTAVLAAINSTLASNLRGGQGLTSGVFSITARDASVHSFSITPTASVAEILQQISASTGGKVTAALSSNGASIVLTDTTGGTGAFIVEGDGATQLGVATAPAGVQSATITSARQQHRYIDTSVLLSSLNAGRGVGTGRFEIFDTRGIRAEVDIASDSRTIGDVIQEINSRGLDVRARVNDNGDGIIIEPRDLSQAGAAKIKVNDLTGTVARSLNIAGEASGSGEQNFINGSYERTIELSATDTLDTLVTRINAGRMGVIASVINDGSSAAPFRLRLTARDTGAAGAFTFDSVGADMGLVTTAEARNARVFFGSDDPARAVMLNSTTNTFDSVIDRVSVDITGRSDDPVTLTIGRDTSAIESAVSDFVNAFNSLSSRIGQLTAYNSETQAKGVLLGDSAALELRRAIFTTVQGRARGVEGGFFALSQVGVTSAQGGQLQFDAAKLRAALEQDPEGVASVFAAFEQAPRDERIEVSPGIFVNNTASAEYSRLGVAEMVVQLADRYLSPSDGLLSRRRQAIDGQIRFQSSRIGQIDQRLVRRREALTRQFANLEGTLAQLQRQSASLSGLSASVASIRR
ncbi:MAG: flagellar filament capping protein FliD [Phycisphaeraceae bacterium]|nr:flagellar filament capping protein FliD [Phycisphaeraceae bacterium]